MQIFTNMTLDDLKTGMIITLRNGYEYAVIRDRVADDLTNHDVFVRCIGDDRGWMCMGNYNYNLTYKACNDRDWDIVKVERGTHPFQFINLKYRNDDRVLLWKEPDAVKLTVAEIENRLGYKIEIVSEEE